jgi:hypothetical protein
MSSNNLQLPTRIDKIDDHDAGDREALNKRLEGIQDNFDRLSLLLPSIPVAGVYPPWHEVGEAGEPAFLTGWTNAAGGAPLRFLRDQMGFVFIGGTITSTTGVDADIFTLPDGYRPAYVTRLATADGIVVELGTDGVVTVVSGLGAGDFALDLTPFRIV